MQGRGEGREWVGKGRREGNGGKGREGARGRKEKRGRGGKRGGEEREQEGGYSPYQS